MPLKLRSHSISTLCEHSPECSRPTTPVPQVKAWKPGEKSISPPIDVPKNNQQFRRWTTEDDLSSEDSIESLLLFKVKVGSI